MEVPFRFFQVGIDKVVIETSQERKTFCLSFVKPPANAIDYFVKKTNIGEKNAPHEDIGTIVENINLNANTLIQDREQADEGWTKPKNDTINDVK